MPDSTLSPGFRSLRDLHSSSETPLPRWTVASPPLMSFTLNSLHRHRCVRPLPVHVAAFLRTDGTNRLPCSVHVVSHHLDGLLRTPILKLPSVSQLLGLVASRSRPWGSLRFQHLPPVFPATALTAAWSIGATWREPRTALHTLQRLPLIGSRSLSPACVLRRVLRRVLLRHRQLFTRTFSFLPFQLLRPLPSVPSCDRRPFRMLFQLLLDFKALLHR